jgi:hypothetical protein
MCTPLNTSRMAIFGILVLILSISLAGQSNKIDKANELDKAIENGLKSIKGKKWDVALHQFSIARNLQDKENFSRYLFNKLVLTDEDRSKRDLSDIEKKISLWRHSMGARQAVRVFQAYAAALAGKRKDADAFSHEVYGTQSPVWGLSWRVFNVAIFDLFEKYVVAEDTKGYGAYLYIAGDLLHASDDERGIRLIERSQQYLPNDPEIAATLAGIYIMSDRTADAKKQAELSLSLNPGQARVHIDLANAEWILGNLQAAKKHAHAAKTLRPDLPGPNATLALVAIDEGDLQLAKEYAENGSRLSEQHKFYQTVLAAYESAAGNTAKARSLMKDAWGSDQPSRDMLEKWFFRRKPLEHILSLR